MSVYVYYGHDHIQRWNVFIDHDIVLTTYGVLTSKWLNIWTIYDIHIVLLSINLMHELQEFFSLSLSYMWFQSCSHVNIFALLVFVYQSMTVICMGEFLFMLSLHLCVLQKNLEERSLQSIHWYKVVLDEAYTIKALCSNASQAIFQLTVDHYWCFTGTPIQMHSHKHAHLKLFYTTWRRVVFIMFDIKRNSMRILGNNKMSLYYVCYSLS
jgi:SNF2 family DNA or RNA helicase